MTGARQKQIEKDFRAWVKLHTGLEVIFDNQNGPRPKRPYITVGDVTGWRKAQMTDEQQQDGDIARLRGRRTKVFQIDCYGEVAGKTNPQHILEGLRDTIDDPIVVETQFNQGWAIENQGDPQDLTEIRDTKFEPRAMMEVTVAAAFSRDTRTGYVEKVDITGTIGTQDRTIEGPPGP